MISITKSKEGNAIIKIAEQKKQALENFRVQVKRITGTKRKIAEDRTKSKAIIVKDLDKIIEPEEIEKAIKKAYGQETKKDIKVLPLRASPGSRDSFTALAVMPSEIANNVLSKRISIFYARSKSSSIKGLTFGKTDVESKRK